MFYSTCPAQTLRAATHSRAIVGTASIGGGGAADAAPPTVTVDTTGLAASSYHAQIVVRTNDPLGPIVRTGLAVRVTG